MPTIKLKTTLAAGATNANILSGNRFEFLPTSGLVRVVQSCHDNGVAAVANVLAAGVRSTISLTNVVLADGADLNARATPDRDKDGVIAEAGAAGDRLIIAVTNLDAVNAAQVETIVDIVPA